MKTYKYFLTTVTIRTTFDHGFIKANNDREALEKAKAQLKYDFDKANQVLGSSDVTLGFYLEFDMNSVGVEIL